MAAARRAMNGVKPMFDNRERPPLLDQVRVEFRGAGGLSNFDYRWDLLEACDVALAVSTI